MIQTGYCLPRSKKGADYVCKMEKNVRTKKLFKGTYSLLSSRQGLPLFLVIKALGLWDTNTHTKLGISLCPLEDKSLCRTLSSCEEICQVGTSKVNSAAKAWKIPAHVSAGEYPLEAIVHMHWTSWDMRTFNEQSIPEKLCINS